MPNRVYIAKPGEDLSTVKAQLDSGMASLRNGELEYARGQRETLQSYLSPSYLGYGSSRITRKGARLSFETLRTIAERSSSVRPPIDFLVNTLSTTPFQISAMEGMRVPKRDIKRAEELFQQPTPMFSTETFRSLLSAVLRDLLVMDHAIILKHLSGNKLDGFEGMDAALFHPTTRKDGRLKDWVQESADGVTYGTFKASEIAHLRRYSRTDSLYGMPVIETIIHEVQALLNASRSFSASLDKNEIPPGILFLLGVHDRQIDRMRSQVKQDAGVLNDYRLRFLTGADDAKWIPFDRSNREMEVAQLVEQVERIVFRNFGVDRIAMGSAADVNRSTAEEMVATRNRSLIKPILDLLADKLTFEILRQINPGLYIEFFYYARTGAEEDLVDEQESETTSADSASGSARIIKPCHACKGSGVTTFRELNEVVGLSCPVCAGSGERRPTYTARPRMIMDTRAQLTNPRRAWQHLADGRDEDQMAKIKARTRRNVTTILESITDRDSAMSATNEVKKILGKFLADAHDLGSAKVKAAGLTPFKKAHAELSERVADFVQFNLTTAINFSKSEADVNNVIAKAIDEANAIIDHGEYVAGGALSELVRVKIGY